MPLQRAKGFTAGRAVPNGAVLASPVTGLSMQQKVMGRSKGNTLSSSKGGNSQPAST